MNLLKIQQLITQWNEKPLFVRHETTNLVHNAAWDNTEVISTVNKRYTKVWVQPWLDTQFHNFEIPSSSLQLITKFYANINSPILIPMRLAEVVFQKCLYIQKYN